MYGKKGPPNLKGLRVPKVLIHLSTNKTKFMKVPEGKVKELCPEGTFNAVEVQIIDLGTQPNANPKFKPSRRCLVGYEVIGEKSEEGDAFIVWKNYNFTNNPSSNLMKDHMAWLGFDEDDCADYDIDNSLNKPALITIKHAKSTRGTFANITTISALPKNSPKLKATTPIRKLYLTKEGFDEKIFKELGQKLQTKIAGSPEYAEAVGSGMKKEVKNGVKAGKVAQAAVSTKKTKTPAKKKK